MSFSKGRSFCKPEDLTRDPKTFKDEIKDIFREPSPAPAKILYAYCHAEYEIGGTKITLRFGDTKDPQDCIEQIYLSNSEELQDQPLVFINACQTLWSNEDVVNWLENRFFQRGVRAYIGAETNIPITFASQFAVVFFSLLFKVAKSDEQSNLQQGVCIGDIFSLTKIFFLKKFKNVGGIFYSYIGKYYMYPKEYGGTQWM